MYEEILMKDLSLLVWLTQLGLTTALPLGGFVLLALWLRDRFGWGNWVLWVGIAVGLISAIDGFITSLKALSRITKSKKDTDPPAVSFNDHD
ncbi:MAG: AtpZ/AtpI family protein [Oscillospiraceae bacterium]|nr:AtpZ/AtpI family protein [Oscillospiraceae bacterium]